MDASPDPSRGSGLAAFCIVMIILSISAVILRIWSRLTSKKQRFWWDDWFAIASLFLVLGSLSTTLLMISAGLGHHASQIAPKTFALLFKYFNAYQFFYQAGIVMSKYSALLFDARIFRVNWYSVIFRTNILTAASLCTMWLLCAIVSDILQCTPVPISWLPLAPEHCLDPSLWLLGTAIANVVIDFYIMILPIPILWSLHTGRARKLVLMGFFFCAYCVIACSLGRLVAIVKGNKKFNTDFTWNTITLFNWTTAEASISIVSICLPNMTALFRRACQHGMAALFTCREYPIHMNRSASRTGSTGSALLQESNEKFRRIINNDDTKSAVDNNRLINTEDRGDLYSVSVSAQRRHSEERDAIVLGQVHMRQDVIMGGNERWDAV